MYYPSLIPKLLPNYSRMFCACANYFRMAISTSRMPQNQSQSIYFSEIFLWGRAKAKLWSSPPPPKLKILYEPCSMDDMLVNEMGIIYSTSTPNPCHVSQWWVWLHGKYIFSCVNAHPLYLAVMTSPETCFHHTTFLSSMG